MCWPEVEAQTGRWWENRGWTLQRKTNELLGYYIFHNSIKKDLTASEQTYEHVSSAEQKVCGKEGDPVEGERPHTVWVANQVKYPDQHTTQAEIHWSAVHYDPISGPAMKTTWN